MLQKLVSQPLPHCPSNCLLFSNEVGDDSNDTATFLHFSMRERVGVKVVKALKRNDLSVSYAAIDMLCSLIQVIC